MHIVNDLNDLIRDLTVYLGIRGKVHIHLSCKKHKSWVGGCWSDSYKTKRGNVRFRHDIKVYLRNLSAERNLHTVIAHELIHAKVFEQCQKVPEIAAVEKKDHDAYFQFWANFIEKLEFAKSWGIRGIYLSDIDVT